MSHHEQEPGEVHSHFHPDDGVESPVSFRRKRDLCDSEMDITPMIDMTFLLLIFFLVSSRIDAKTGVDLPKARYGATVPIKESVILTVGEGVEGSSRVYKGDGVDATREIAALSPEEQEEQIAAYVQEELESSVPRKHHVIVKAARNVKHREVTRVVNSLAKVEALQQVHLAVLDNQ